VHFDEDQSNRAPPAFRKTFAEEAMVFVGNGITAITPSLHLISSRWSWTENYGFIFLFYIY
jgi:hypothetical protein